MAKKIAGYVKLQIDAGKATPAPPVGPALGQHGLNIMGNETVTKYLYKSIDICINVKPSRLRK